MEMKGSNLFSLPPPKGHYDALHRVAASLAHTWTKNTQKQHKGAAGVSRIYEKHILTNIHKQPILHLLRIFYRMQITAYTDKHEDHLGRKNLGNLNCSFFNVHLF